MVSKLKRAYLIQIHFITETIFLQRYLIKSYTSCYTNSSLFLSFNLARIMSDALSYII